ncbi:MAG: DUF2851 family protein, partial [Lentisphaerota bacterium]
MKSGMATCAGFISHDFFPRARWYAPPGLPATTLVREGRKRVPAQDFSERHLQCVWYDAQWRPEGLRTDDGDLVVVEDPGLWNLEAGPDFLGAALHIGPEQRRIKGDVEIHVHPSDWKTHGHASDSRYQQVRIHVTYLAGASDPGLFPAGTIHMALKDRLTSNPRFSFEGIDLLAYPTAARATPPPCREALQTCSPEEKEWLLEAAGEERLRRKAMRMAEAIHEKGANQVLYEEIMAALGYKQNKLPFRTLAERIPLRTLQEEADASALKAYALLLGVAGLLPEDMNRKWDAETRAFIRSLWNAWWKCRDKYAKRILPRAMWQLSGIRPANHPARRLMAAADLFTTEEPLSLQIREVLQDHPGECMNYIEKILRIDSGLYWGQRLSLAGKASQKPVAVLGRDRASAILINVITPYLAATHEGLAPAALHEKHL